MKKRFRMLLLLCVLGLDVWVDIKMLHEDLVMKMWMTKSLCVLLRGRRHTVSFLSRKLYSVRCPNCIDSLTSERHLWILRFCWWKPAWWNLSLGSQKEEWWITAKREETNPWAEEFMGKHQKMSNIRKHSRANMNYQITWMRSVMSW